MRFPPRAAIPLGRLRRARPPCSHRAPAMATRSEAPKLRNVLSSLDPRRLQLILAALPIAHELYDANNERFISIRLELLALYGDEASPKLLNAEFPARANHARSARSVGDGLARCLIKLIAAAKAAQLCGPATRVEAATTQHDELIRLRDTELEGSMKLPHRLRARAMSFCSCPDAATGARCSRMPRCRWHTPPSW